MKSISVSFSSIIVQVSIAFLFLLSSCISTNNVSLNVLVPAEINVPQHIKKVVVANRSLPSKNETWKNVLEGFLTQESIFADRDASGQCIAGLTNELNSNPRFQAVLKNDDELKGTGTKQFPALLEWNRVSRICDTYNADALILLETFDSDVMMSKGKHDVKKKVNNKDVTVVEFDAGLNIYVNTGWRIYDPKNKKIIDENTFRDNQQWSSTGETQEAAISKLPSKRTALNNSGDYAGKMFGKRISPNWTTVSRTYYVRKHDDFKTAKLMARAGNWDGAAQIWNRLTTNSDAEVAARACYNMAVVCEINGKLDEAISWTEQAIKKYSFKPASNYMSILKNRQWQEQRLNEQMENK